MKEIINRRVAAGMIAGAIALSACATTEQATPSFPQRFETPSPTVIVESPTPGMTSSPIESPIPTPKETLSPME